MIIERIFLSNLHKNLCCGCSLESPQLWVLIGIASAPTTGFYEEISKIIPYLQISSDTHLISSSGGISMGANRTDPSQTTPQIRLVSSWSALFAAKCLSKKLRIISGVHTILWVSQCHSGISRALCHRFPPRSPSASPPWLSISPQTRG